MTETQKLELFFSQTTELCHRYSKGQFPSKTRDTLHAWSDASLKAAQQEEFLEILAKGLAALRDQLPLGNLIESPSIL